MTEDVISVQKAFSKGREMPWTWARFLSRVYLGATPAEIHEAELIEARFFGPDQEIRLFKVGEELKAVRLTVDPNDREIERIFTIDNRMFGRTLTVRYGLEADEDGQMYKKYARLAGWEG